MTQSCLEEKRKTRAGMSGTHTNMCLPEKCAWFCPILICHSSQGRQEQWAAMSAVPTGQVQVFTHVLTIRRSELIYIGVLCGENPSEYSDSTQKGPGDSVMRGLVVPFCRLIMSFFFQDGGHSCVIVLFFLSVRCLFSSVCSAVGQLNYELP